jgi:hypothetical protein
MEHNNLPITMNQGIAKKVLAEKNHVDPTDLEDLVGLMEDSPLALISKHQHVIVVLDKQREQNNMMSFLEINKQKISISVNDIRSVYFDNVLAELDNSIEHGDKIHTNVKTKEWLRSFGVTVPKDENHYIRSLPQLSEKTKAWLEKYTDIENAKTTV